MEKQRRSKGGNAVYKILDFILGEKSFALDIAYVGDGGVQENPEGQGMIKLDELPAYVKWKKSKHALGK